jgi:hypothetical protein
LTAFVRASSSVIWRSPPRRQRFRKSVVPRRRDVVDTLLVPPRKRSTRRRDSLAQLCDLDVNRVQLGADLGWKHGHRLAICAKGRAGRRTETRRDPSPQVR